MAWIATAIVGGAVIGGIANSLSSQNAANAQTQAADASNQTQLDMFNKQQQNAQPYMDAGKQALGQLQTEMPDLQRQFTMGDFHQDPGYQFQLNQGLQAMQRSAAAKGMLNSVGTLQNLNNYAQGTANTDYQQALQNFTNNQQQRYNMLAGIAGMGNTANGQIANVGMNAANNINQAQIGAGNARSAAAMSVGNNISNMVNTGANTWMTYNMMKNFNQPAAALPAQSLWAGNDASSSVIA